MWNNIYSGLQLLGENFYCSAPGSESIELTTYIGAAVISMFSEAIQSRFGAVGIHIAVSSILEERVTVPRLQLQQLVTIQRELLLI